MRTESLGVAYLLWRQSFRLCGEHLHLREQFIEAFGHFEYKLAFEGTIDVA